MVIRTQCQVCFTLFYKKFSLGLFFQFEHALFGVDASGGAELADCAVGFDDAVTGDD